MDDSGALGPISYLIVQFPGNKMTGEGLPILVDLVERGVIRILDLTSVVTETAASEKLVARLYDEDEKPGLDPMIKFSTVMILARNDKDFGLLRDWDLQKPEPGKSPWSDDYSSLLGPLIAKFEEDD